MAGETILVIDDNSQMRNLMERTILAPLGYRVVTAPDGKTGLRMAVSHPIDLIFLDMSMPGMSGLDMLVALRQTECRSPVIFMTSYGTENIAVEAFRLGVRDYLNKPFTLEEVQLAADRALRESRLAREREELSRNLAAADAVRVTVVTLSHYLNSNLMAVSGSLTLLREALDQGQGEVDVDEIIHKGKESIRGIQAVLNVLLRTTSVKTTSYSDAAPMIDIAAELDAEMQKIHTAPLAAQDAFRKPDSGEGHPPRAGEQRGSAPASYATLRKR